MRVLVQRVESAAVTLVESGAVTGRIEAGMLLLVGFARSDGEEEVEWMADKLVGLRIFADDAGKMNLSLNQIGGSVLVVSQFTLYGDAAKGRRPSFVKAAAPDLAKRLYDDFVGALRQRCMGPVATGRFGAYMAVESVNSGPVTLWLER